MPKTVNDWRALLRRWWWLLLLAAVLSGIEVALPLLRGMLPIGEWLRGIIYGLVTAGAFATRALVTWLVGGKDD